MRGDTDRGSSDHVLKDLVLFPDSTQETEEREMQKQSRITACAILRRSAVHETRES